MASLPHCSCRKVFLFYLLVFVFTSIFACVYTETQTRSNEIFGRKLLDSQKHDQAIKKKTSTLSTKNQTKLIKPSISTKNQTKLIKTTTGSTKNQTKLLKLTSNESKNKTKLIKPTSEYSTKETPTIKAQLKKLNSTSKASNSTKSSSLLTMKSSDLVKPGTPKNKTAKPITTKPNQTQSDKKLSEPKSRTQNKNQATDKQAKQQKTQKPTQPSWFDQQDEDDLVSEFRDLPSKFQEAFLPDMERISKSSKVYLTKANKEITKGFKSIVGNEYAPTIASIVSFAFILIPLLLVSLIFTRIKAYFSLQKLLICIQVYLSIYFSILCLSSLVTGLEPLRFFYATSQSTYICVQVLQTLGYVFYLLLLLMYLVLVFSTEAGLVSKLLVLGQIFVSFGVGLHYYMTVFHRAVLHQPPKTSWRVAAIYATCFLVICLLARAERRKKAYLAGDGEGKNS
ncbi:unnamed protein product [Ilex paraguariensis]|uniref:Uncharacterized protein n=1 Tax=Ilex paraguariensis TaxID=185542 RepID=A0ABC8TZL9_9AQUA